MRSAPQLLHGRAGSLPGVDCIDSPTRCWVCAGEWPRSVAREKWMGSNFIGQNRARNPASERVCEPCVWAMSGRPPDTLRMYSQLVDDRGWLKLNKGHKPAMRAWLREPKRGEWFAAIADSGQKHVVPWAPINPPGSTGSVMFEETLVRLPRDASGWRAVDDVAALLTAGASKESIESGDYTGFAWQRCATEIRTFEAAYAAARGSAWFALAVWLAQRDEQEVAARMDREKAEKAAKKEREKNARRDSEGAAPKPARGTPTRGTKRVSKDAGRQHPEALGPTAGQDPNVRANKRDSGAVVHESVADPEVGCAQCSLF